MMGTKVRPKIDLESLVIVNKSMRSKLNSAAEVEALIQEVKSRECLWKLKHSHYYDGERLAAWGEVAAKLNVKVGFAKLKWKNMRDTFRRELMKHHKNGDPHIYKGKWRFYEQMWFLQGQMGVGRRAHEEETLEESEDQVTVLKCEPYIAEDVEEDQEALNAIYFDENEDDFDGVLPKKPRRDEDSEDYDMMYLKSLLPFFRTLDPMRKLVVRTKIQDMLLSEMAASRGNKS